jgi:hypothetical protein
MRQKSEPSVTMKGAILASFDSLSARSSPIRRSRSTGRIKPEPKHSVGGIWALLWPIACTVAFMASLMIEQQAAFRKRSEAQRLSLGLEDIFTTIPVTPQPRFTSHRANDSEMTGKISQSRDLSIALLRWALRRSLGRFGMVGSIYRSTVICLVSDYSDHTYRLGKARPFGSDDSR